MKRAVWIGLVFIMAMAYWGAFAESMAVPQRAAVLVDGREVRCYPYEIYGANYFKLRDFACMLRDTDKAFDVEYDEAHQCITVETRTKSAGRENENYLPYIPLADDLAPVGEEAKAALLTPGRYEVNPNRELPESTLRRYLTDIRDDYRYPLAAYQIDGYNYFKLRTLGELFGVAVTYDQGKRQVQIDTAGQPAVGESIPASPERVGEVVGEVYENPEPFYLDYMPIVTYKGLTALADTTESIAECNSRIPVTRDVFIAAEDLVNYGFYVQEYEQYGVLNFVTDLRGSHPFVGTEIVNTQPDPAVCYPLTYSDKSIQINGTPVTGYLMNGRHLFRFSELVRTAKMSKPYLTRLEAQYYFELIPSWWYGLYVEEEAANLAQEQRKSIYYGRPADAPGSYVRRGIKAELGRPEMRCTVAGLGYGENWQGMNKDIPGYSNVEFGEYADDTLAKGVKLYSPQYGANFQYKGAVRTDGDMENGYQYRWKMETKHRFGGYIIWEGQVEGGRPSGYCKFYNPFGQTAYEGQYQDMPEELREQIPETEL